MNCPQCNAARMVRALTYAGTTVDVCLSCGSGVLGPLTGMREFLPNDGRMDYAVDSLIKALSIALREPWGRVQRCLGSIDGRSIKAVAVAFVLANQKLLKSPDSVRRRCEVDQLVRAAATTLRLR